MSMIKKILFIFILFTFLFTSKSFGEDLKKIGKYKDWETMVLAEASGKVCFAQSSPILQSPKTNKRDEIEVDKNNKILFLVKFFFITQSKKM